MSDTRMRKIRFYKTEDDVYTIRIGGKITFANKDIEKVIAYARERDILNTTFIITLAKALSLAAGHSNATVDSVKELTDTTLKHGPAIELEPPRPNDKNHSYLFVCELQDGSDSTSFEQMSITTKSVIFHYDHYKKVWPLVVVFDKTISEYVDVAMLKEQAS